MADDTDRALYPSGVMGPYSATPDVPFGVSSLPEAAPFEPTADDRPPPEPRADPIAEARTEMRRSWEETQEQLRGFRERRDAIEARRREAVEPLEQELLETLREPREEPPPIRELPPPPKFDFAKERQNFLGVAGIFALFAGAAGRQRSINALTAYSGFFEGMKEGQHERAEEAYKEWEAQVKGIQNQVSQETNRYKQIFENRKLDVLEKQAAIKTVAAEYQNQEMYEAARQQDILHSATLYQTMVGNLARLEETAQAHRDAHEWHQIRMQRTQATISPETARLTAERMAAGDTSATTGMFSGLPGKENQRLVLEELTKLAGERGWTGADLAAAKARFTAFMSSMRTAGTRETNMEVAAREVDKVLPIAEDAAKKVNRTGWRPVSQVELLMAKGFANPDQAAFSFANQTLVNAYAATVSRTGASTVSAQQHAYATLDEAYNLEQYLAATNILRQELQAIRTAPEEARQAIAENFMKAVSRPRGTLPAPPAGEEWEDVPGQPGVKRLKRSAP